MKLKLLLVTLLILGAKDIYSQQFEFQQFQKGVQIDFSVVDEKRIEKGIKILNQAQQDEQAAIQKIEAIGEDEKLKQTNPDYKKAVKDLIGASEVYKEGFSLISIVYIENSDKFRKSQQKINHYAAGVNKAKFYEQKATKAYTRATNIRNLLLQMEKFDLIQYKMAEALELELLSIRDRGRALRIYCDFPVEYNYRWEDDVTEEQVNAAFSDPAISRPAEDLFVQTRKEKIQDTPRASVQEPIIFKVQIAAHTLPMTKEYIKDNIYNGSEKVIETFDGTWYKYSIGNYNNFNEAKEMLSKSNVRKAFIVAYQGDEKLTIKSALAIIKANQ